MEFQSRQCLDTFIKNPTLPLIYLFKLYFLLRVKFFVTIPITTEMRFYIVTSKRTIFEQSRLLVTRIIL